MPFTYDVIPSDETREQKAYRENREMRVRADYEDMINAALDAIPMEQQSDFRTAVHDLEKILKMTTGGGTLDFDSALKASMETVYEYYAQPELFVEQAANYSEYQKIIADQIHTRIDKFNSFSAAEKNQYVMNQKAMREQAARDQATVAAGEPRRAQRAMQLLSEEELLAQTFGDAAPSPAFFQPVVDPAVARRNQRLEELYSLLEGADRDNPRMHRQTTQEDIDHQAQTLRNIARELPDLLGNNSRSFMGVMEHAHPDNKQIIINALGGYSGIVEKFLGNGARCESLVDVIREVPKTHWQHIIALVAYKMDELLPNWSAFVHLYNCILRTEPDENLIYFSRALGLPAMGRWIKACAELDGGYASVAYDIIFTSYRTRDTVFIKDLLSSFTDEVVDALYGGPSGAAKMESIFRFFEDSYRMHNPGQDISRMDAVWNESKIAFFTGLGNDRLNAIINSCDDETIKNKLKSRIEAAGIELRSPGLNR